MGAPGKGCHVLIRRNSVMLPRSPTAPPTSEISTASVNNCRRMRVRLDPKRKPQSNFPGTVGSACGKQTAQVGACRQQN